MAEEKHGSLAEKLLMRYEEAKDDQKLRRAAVIDMYRFALDPQTPFLVANQVGQQLRKIARSYMDDYPTEILVLILTNCAGEIAHGTIITEERGPILNTQLLEAAISETFRMTVDAGDTFFQCASCRKKLCPRGIQPGIPRASCSNKCIDRIVFAGMVCAGHPLCTVVRDKFFGDRFNSHYDTASSVARSLAEETETEGIS